jgi:hypothetical protein
MILILSILIYLLIGVVFWMTKPQEYYWVVVLVWPLAGFYGWKNSN